MYVVLVHISGYTKIALRLGLFKLQNIFPSLPPLFSLSDVCMYRKQLRSHGHRKGHFEFSDSLNHQIREQDEEEEEEERGRGKK